MIQWMSKEEIKNWSEAYDNDPDHKEDREIKNTVGHYIRDSKTLSKDNLRKMIHWKFSFSHGRERLMLRYLQ